MAREHMAREYSEMKVTPLEHFPPPDRWDDWTELDPTAWPKRVEKRYVLVPTTCFNCEAACGLVAYVDKETTRIKKLEGNPYHPASRGRNCAKGPATLNQIDDPERILTPMRREGPRGSGRYVPATWDEALDAIAAPIRRALLEGRKNEVMYHVGRPGHDGFMDRVLQAWGIDGHNSHTNVCSGAARLGYALWQGSDRPSPDHANAKFLLLLSSHLETGHYFNPHAQRIIEGKMAGAKICVVDVRLSNTASRADWWLAPWPGTEPTMLLAMARVILEEGLYDREFLHTWTNWRDWLLHLDPAARPDFEPLDFERFLAALKAQYSRYTPEYAALECKVSAEALVAVAREIGKAGSAFAAHVWRNAASGNLGGWQVARCLVLLSTLVGAIGTEGGTNPASSDKFVPAPFLKPPPQDIWNELSWPREYPLAHHEMSFLLPHFMLEGRGKLAAYFTRVYNPVWTNPDGLLWEKVLQDESLVGLHVALTPTWSETAQYADWVLPVGLGAERHDLQSQETHSARWIAFRQPVQRVALARMGRPVKLTREANIGEVWEEDELWTALSWKIDPDGALGVRKWFESPYRPGEPVTVDEYYQWIFERSVPGLPAAAAAVGMAPLEYMRRHGAFLVEAETYAAHMKALGEAELAAATVDEARGEVRQGERVVGVIDGGTPRVGFATPSRRLELWSPTLHTWKWPEHALPGAIETHVHWRHCDPDQGRFVLVPTFRLPTLIHTRSANSKWLMELSNTNPVWISIEDAAKIGVETGDLIRVETRIGHFVNKAWVTEGVRPGVLACSHHLGRWRLQPELGTNRISSALVERQEVGGGRVRFRRVEGIRPFKSADPDTQKIWWTDGGVHQNLTFPVQPDPVSGMHCWHQLVTARPAGPGDQYGDVEVDPAQSMAVYREWLALTRPAPGPGGLRRPLWLARAVKPSVAAYQCPPLDPPKAR